MTDLGRGTIFAGHRIDDVAGRGGMGVVYRATQLDLDRTVALKVIAAPLLEDEAARHRFVREARAAAGIDHPNVLPVHYVGEAEGTAYIAMRYVDGDDLRSLVRRVGPLPAARAVALIVQVAAALDAIHARGIVHRDVKPANILLTASDHVYVGDFGLAKHTLSVGGTTKPGQWVGTLDYVAPEQIRGEKIDARCDVYALGCVLFWVLTGQVPFPREGDEARIWAHLSEPPPRPSAVVPELPRALDDVVARAMAKQPDARFQSAGELGGAASRAVAGGAGTEHDDSAGRPAGAPDAPGAGAATRSRAATVRVPLPDDDDSTISSPRPAEANGRSRAGRRRRAPLLAGVALLAVAGVAAVALALSADDDDSGGDDGRAQTTGERPSPTATSAGREAARPRVTSTIDGVGTRPNGLTVAAGHVWVTSFRGSQLSLVDAETNRLARPLTIGQGAAGIGATGNTIWVALAAGRKQLLRIDARRRRVTGRYPLAGDPTALLVGSRAVWVASLTPVAGGADRLERFDPRSGAKRGDVSVAAGIQGMTADRDGVWITHRRTSTLAHITAATGERSRPIALPYRPGRLAAGGEYLWLSYRRERSLSRIDPSRRRIVAIPGPSVGREPPKLVYGAGYVWFANYGEHTLNRIDPARARLEGEPLQVGLNPNAIAISGRTVWVTGQGDDSLTRVEF